MVDIACIHYFDGKPTEEDIEKKKRMIINTLEMKLKSAEKYLDSKRVDKPIEFVINETEIKGTAYYEPR